MAGSSEDVRGVKQVRSILSRRGIDVSRADVRVQNGVAYIRGFVAPMPSANIPDIAIEMEHVAKIIRQKPEIRNVVLEITLPR
jgi:hypothetical protein